MFHHTVETAKSVDEAVRAVEQALQKRKFGVLWTLDIPAKLREKGVGFQRPYRVLEVCNPVEAKRVLTRNALVGYFLPCKIVVYEDGGKTKIGLPKPTVLVEMIQDAGLKDIAGDVEKILVEAVDEAASAQ